MTLHEEPPIVDLDDILDEQDTDAARVTAGQWTLVVVGGVVGIAGLLTLLAVAAPILVNIVDLIHTLSEVGTLTP
jgi:hypothetical protein